MLDKITYSLPANWKASTKTANLNTTQAVAKTDSQSFPSADTQTAQNQPKATTNAEAAKNNVVFFPLNNHDYLRIRKPEKNTSLLTASAAYSKTLEYKTMNDKLLKRLGIKECQTCNERRYQDESTDSGVSFKTPTHISPENALAAVSAHEQEHVSNQRADAAQEEKQIVSQSVQIFSSVCPECGKSYVSGGETQTVTIAKTAQPNAMSEMGQVVDKYA